jgi:SAM-dependent methyltransferase
MEPDKFYSQLDLPFQETNYIYLREIFLILERLFDLKKDSNQLFVDLGSGNGQVIIYSAVNYRIKSIGIEIDPLLIEETKNSVKDLKKLENYKKIHFKKIRIIHGDFYQQNLKNYNYIYIYSLPTMQKYLEHVFKTAKNGSVIISHFYPLKNLTNYLVLKFKLEHNNDNQKAYTFFYKRI